ncbi:MAG: hypothetical protein IKX66_01785, partial [Clostridia bacterium]|nr:hypothetical protein [Clostridia bacterium]
MPKETGRTKRIRAAVLDLLSDGKDRDEREIRQACFGKLAENDADEKETQRLKDSIRRIVSQMQASGELAPAKRETTRKTGTPEGGEETVNAATPSDALRQSPEEEKETADTAAILSAPDGEKNDGTVPEAKNPAKDPSGSDPEKTKREARQTVRMPKAKQMNEFLSDVLKEDASEKEETLVGRAVAFFGVSGEQVNGVRGLVIQCLMEQKKNGTVLFDKADGYKKAPAESPGEDVRETLAPEQKPAALPQVAVKRVRGTRAEAKTARKTDGEPKRGLSRLVMNENRFAEQINHAGGAFFTEFVARLFEEYYRARG